MEVTEIEKLADIMEARGLSRVCFEDADGSKLELERPGGVPTAALPTGMAVPSAYGPGTINAGVPAQPGPDVHATPEGDPLDVAKLVEVSAPMVGVFYAAPAPGAEPFVHVGSKVHKGDTLCVIEAMKLMNEVTAECDGEIVDICVEDGELVEYGCCLMKMY